jgi:diaminohydroxyphosphoribosylaminopyrimidine deaminase / 5-amino-6-(5-phosphoribosylamino)uracil reductase
MSGLFSDPAAVMRRALELAQRGAGFVEPNPMVGAVIVDDSLNVIAEGYHQQFGGPHAEVHALDKAGARAAGATLFVTLEPCCHRGKTPPCADAVISAGIRKVVIGTADPAPHVAGGGIARLEAAGIAVEVGLLGDEARRLIAPFAKLITTGRPFVHAKWAMSLDGKIAARTGMSQWISGSRSREVVHQLRGRMDAIVVGSATASIDDPLLTARPAGPRTATRIVVDSQARLPVESQLVRTLSSAPVLVAATESAPQCNVDRLADAGVEVLVLPAVRGFEATNRPRVDLAAVLDELGRRRMMNVLVEGGGELLGSLFDHDLIDAVHVFIAPKLIGGADAPTPLAGLGLSHVPEFAQVRSTRVECWDGDVYIYGVIEPILPASSEPKE